MEHKIGEIFEYNGKWYQCVKSDGTCKGCAGECKSYSFYYGFEGCAGKIFKKLEKVGEPYMTGNKLIQRYKIYPTTYCINVYGWYYQSLDIKSWTIDIEIKQNKEDMGEEKEDIKPYNKYFSEGTVSNTEHLAVSKFKPFDIEAAKAGKPVCTRDGRKARIICLDSNGGRPIVALVTECNDEEEIPYKYHCDGFYNCQSIPSDNDLMMLPEKKEGWVNVHKSKDSIFLSKEEAKLHKDDFGGYIATIKIEWEE